MKRLTAKQFVKKFPDAEANGNCLLNIACSQCGNRDTFRIQFTGTAEVDDNGSSEDGDHEWEDDSSCQCSCGAGGRVKDFTIEGLDELIESEEIEPQAHN